jgi:4a-hydroxytetrahydrobiopterin dehydratase
MPLLTDAQIADGLTSLPGWTRDGASIRKQFTFASFPAAVDYVQRLVPGAEAADHHPDLTINYRRVTVVYSTHSEGGVTEKDLAGARTAEALANQLGAPATK